MGRRGGEKRERYRGTSHPGLFSSERDLCAIRALGCMIYYETERSGQLLVAPNSDMYCVVDDLTNSIAAKGCPLSIGFDNLECKGRKIW